MKLLVCPFIVVLSIVLQGAVAAQGRPDFSGTWLMILPSAPAQEILVVRQDASSITFADEAHLENARLAFDEPTKIPGGHAAVAVIATASWRGATLVVATTFTRTDDGLVMSRREDRWSLQPDGRLHVEMVRRPASGPAATETRTYRRR